MKNSQIFKPKWTDRLTRITSNNKTYYPEVDGLRFLAITSVLLFHVWFAITKDLSEYYNLSASKSWLLHIEHGHRGVELFFGISGFILGLPFANHFLGNGSRVRFGNYLKRRLTRLEPPYVIALLGFYILAFALKTPDALDADFLTSFWLRIVYCYGLVRQQSHSLNGVTWSLEIEVQFYLLAPLFSNIFRAPALWRRIFLLGSIGAFPLLTETFSPSLFTLFSFVQFFFMGFLLADIQVVHPPKLDPLWARNLSDLAGIAGLLGFLLLPDHGGSEPFLAWVVGLIILGGLRGSKFRRVLSVPFFAIIGGMCYSIYLLHYPLMSFIADKMSLTKTNIWESFFRLGVVALPLVLIFGTIFFLLIERPCMNPNWPQRLWGSISKLMQWVKRNRSAAMRGLRDR